MNGPAPTVALHDVKDVDSYVRATLNRSGIRFEEEEYEELVAEGIVILFEMAKTYQPHMPGYDQPGRFSGYAARYLPRKLGDAWHRMHAEHCYLNRPDGSREWVYLPRPVSLDAAYERAAADGSGDSVERAILPPSKWVRSRAA